jgi:hypothetical protein
MTLELFALIVTCAGSAIGATWLLRSKLSDIETAIRGHVEADEQYHKATDARVIKLEQRNRGRR